MHERWQLKWILIANFGEKDQGFQSYKKQLNSWFGDGVVFPIGKMVEVSTTDHNLVNQWMPPVNQHLGW